MVILGRRNCSERLLSLHISLAARMAAEKSAREAQEAARRHAVPPRDPVAYADRRAVFMHEMLRSHASSFRDVFRPRERAEARQTLAEQAVEFERELRSLQPNMQPFNLNVADAPASRVPDLPREDSDDEFSEELRRMLSDSHEMPYLLHYQDEEDHAHMLRPARQRRSLTEHGATGMEEMMSLRPPRGLQPLSQAPPHSGLPFHLRSPSVLPPPPPLPPVPRSAPLHARPSAPFSAIHGTDADRSRSSNRELHGSRVLAERIERIGRVSDVSGIRPDSVAEFIVSLGFN